MLIGICACGGAESAPRAPGTLAPGARVYEVRDSSDDRSLRFVILEPIAEPAADMPRRRWADELAGSTTSPLHVVVALPPATERTFTLLGSAPCVVRSATEVAIASGHLPHGSPGAPLLGAWMRARVLDATPCGTAPRYDRMAIAGAHPGVHARLWKDGRVIPRELADSETAATLLVEEERAVLRGSGVGSVQVWRVESPPGGEAWPWEMYRSWSTSHPIGMARLRRDGVLVRDLPSEHGVAGFLVEGERVLFIELRSGDPPGWTLTPVP